jgi:hypothetical protein
MGIEMETETGMRARTLAWVLTGRGAWPMTRVSMEGKEENEDEEEEEDENKDDDDDEDEVEEEER